MPIVHRMRCSPVEVMRDALQKLFTVQLVHAGGGQVHAENVILILPFVTDEGHLLPIATAEDVNVESLIKTRIIIRKHQLKLQLPYFRKRSSHKEDTEALWCG
jgi:hypothetical protein